MLTHRTTSSAGCSFGATVTLSVASRAHQGALARVECSHASSSGWGYVLISIIAVASGAAFLYLGYEEAAAIAKQSLAERRTIREVVLERGHVENGTLTVEQLDDILDVLDMTRPAGG